MAHADQVKGVVGENLRKAVDWLPTGRQLLKIRTDCDLNAYVPELPSLETIRLAPPNEADLLAFYEKYGFKGLVRSRGAGALSLQPSSPLPKRHSCPRRFVCRARTGCHCHWRQTL